MKTLVLSMISIAATVAAMTACTSESDEINNVVEGPVEIQARAGVGSITTKASMDDWDTAGTNVFFCRVADTKETPVWNTATPIFAQIKDKNIKFYEEVGRVTESKQYYNADENLLSWMAGCYLGDATISSSGTTLTKNAVSFTITGQEDIMATNGISGTKKTAFADFSFKHLLSNLSFIITPKEASDLTAVQKAFGKVTKIEVLNQPNFLDLELGATPSLKTNATPGSSTFTYSKESEITDNASYGDIMVFPTENAGKTGSAISIKVYTSTATNGIPVDVLIKAGSEGLAANTKYAVTLSFSATDINATATIGAWTSSEGEGTVK